MWITAGRSRASNYLHLPPVTTTAGGWLTCHPWHQQQHYRCCSRHESHRRGAAHPLPKGGVYHQRLAEGTVASCQGEAGIGSVCLCVWLNTRITVQISFVALLIYFPFWPCSKSEKNGCLIVNQIVALFEYLWWKMKQGLIRVVLVVHALEIITSYSKGRRP